MSRLTIAVAALFVMACSQGPKGDTGATGPAGATGPTGAPGAAGNPVTAVPLAVDDPACPAGGAALVFSDGGAIAVCHGTQGPQGMDGLPGAPGLDGAPGDAGPEGPQGPQGIQGPQGAQGPQGPAGPAGAPADAMLYGDASAGDLTVSASTNWAYTAPANLNFNNFTINSGVTLTVPSGLVLRVNGTFTNNGTLVVIPWGGGGYQEYVDEPNSTGTASTLVLTVSFPADRGVAMSAAGPGVYTRRPTVAGLSSASALTPEQARDLVRLTHVGGGGGAAGWNSNGGYGGGTLTILARTLLRNTGTITADGAAGNLCAGGGAGGVVVLASATRVETGTVTARGGAGGSNFSNLCSAGGGGGGGIIRIISPDLVGGTTSVTGGAAGVLTGSPVRSGPASSGGGGGACGGPGGPGGALPSGSPGLANGQAGWPGMALSTQANPPIYF